MKLCMMCDLHLPENPKAVQYDVLRWACADARQHRADALVFAGDFTADGCRESGDFFVRTLRESGIPSVILPGNSDLRRAETRSYLDSLASPTVNRMGDTWILAVNDSAGTVDAAARKALSEAPARAIVVMHHPISALKPPDAAFMQAWRAAHPDNPLFYGHLHFSRDQGNDHCLQAADPDKAIGEPPCISYYDTETRKLEKSHYACPVPPDFYDYLGISCFYPETDIGFATRHGLKTLELRPNAVRCCPELLEGEAKKWRAAGGRNLSMHAPEVTDADFRAGDPLEWSRFLDLAQRLEPDRLTIHVPKVSVRHLRTDPRAMERISAFLAENLSRLDPNCVIGVENMHMTAADQPDDTRRFGYLPAEVLEFADALGGVLPNPVGVNLDTGHARNNAPFSQKNTLSQWYCEVGNRAVGYHIHQVTLTDGKMENHMPITDVYGNLISYASFFRSWQTGILRKAPVICEIRGHSEPGACRSTIQMFERLRDGETE